MLRASLRRTAAATAPLRTVRRNLNLHEYQAAALMAEKGVNVPFGLPATTVEEAVAAAATIGDEQVVIKSQILAGGRGLGSFTNGLKGGVHVIKSSEVAEYAGKMLGGTLVTKQSGPEGKPVNTILLAKKMNLTREMYLAIMLDRASMGPVIIACSEGGTSIEDLAASHPDKIIKTPIDINVGITDAQATAVAKGLEVTGDVAAAAEQIKSLYRLFTESDCTMVEVNPLAEDDTGLLIAADAKVASTTTPPSATRRSSTSVTSRRRTRARWPRTSGTSTTSASTATLAAWSTAPASPWPRWTSSRPTAARPPTSSTSVAPPR
jgi:succinyl-CoA synthetase beta subunit